jgi:hypothetical protein
LRFARILSVSAMSEISTWKLPAYVLAASALCVAFSGCGDGTKRATVTGTVTYNSQPVTGGSITFNPVVTGAEGEAPARSAVGEIQSNGTFNAGTEKPGDGVSIGKHRISYSAPAVEWVAPEWDGQGEPPQAPKSEFEGLVPKEGVVEVGAGSNELKIELVQPSAPPAG